MSQEITKKFAWIPDPWRGYLRFPLIQYRSRRERIHHLRLVRKLNIKRSHEAEYENYLLTQLTRSWHMRTHVHPRVGELVRRFSSLDLRPKAGLSVLCVGCRNSHELQVFREAGYENIVGVDLFSVDQNIVSMDMHALRFPDSQFDVIFACHSLEHSFAPALVLAEFKRVIRENGACLIEVPIRFKKFPGRTDLQDFDSLQGLMSACSDLVGQVLLAEETKDTARLIFVVSKHGTATTIAAAAK